MRGGGGGAKWDFPIVILNSELMQLTAQYTNINAQDRDKWKSVVCGLYPDIGIDDDDESDCSTIKKQVAL